MWGSVGGILKAICVVCFDFQTIKHLSGIPVHFCTYSLSRAGLFMTRQVKYVTSGGCGLKGQCHFQVSNIINNSRMGEG